MPSYLKHEVVLVRYPFSDLSGSKVRPAIVVNGDHVSQDLLIVPLTSKTSGLLPGEFVLLDWMKAGLNIETAIKRGIYTIKDTLVIKRIGMLEETDATTLEQSLCDWLNLP